MAVAVGLDGDDSAFPCGAGGVVFRSGTEDGGDVVGRVDLGGDDELALGSAVALEELLFECAEVADVIGAVVDPGDGVVVGALIADFLNGAGVEPIGVGALGLEPFKLGSEVVAFAAVALEEAQGVQLVVGLSDAEVGVFEVCSLAPGIASQHRERACLRHGEVVERLPDAVVLVSKLRRGQCACARVDGLV